ALSSRVDELVLFGRLDPIPGTYPYTLPAGVRFVALPHYPNVRALPAVAREAAELDGVWLFGPHPLALAFARAARRRGIPVALGVRQDFPAYIASRAR